MNFQVDLDPRHRVIRLTLLTAVIDLRCAEEVYTRLSKIAGRKPGQPAASGGGSYAGIYDLSAVTGTTITVNMIRGFARRAPSIPMGRTHVVVGKDPSIYELARIFQMCWEFRRGDRFEVVRSLKEAYHMVGVRPEDFTQRLFPKHQAA